jgi:hypothetical protein
MSDCHGSITYFIRHASRYIPVCKVTHNYPFGSKLHHRFWTHKFSTPLCQPTCTKTGCMGKWTQDNNRSQQAKKSKVSGYSFNVKRSAILDCRLLPSIFVYHFSKYLCFVKLHCHSLIDQSITLLSLSYLDQLDLAVKSSLLQSPSTL